MRQGATLGAQLVRVFGDRTLGPVGLALFIHGVSQGTFTPLIALWLAGAYHRGGGAIAAYFACAAAGGMVLNPVLGRLSDRLGRRRPTAVLAVGMQTAGLAALALHPPLWAVLALAAGLMSGQLQPHLFAMVNDYLGHGRPGLPRGATIAIERTTVSAAWAVGAPLGGWLLGHRYWAMFGAAAALNAGALAVAALLCREGVPADDPGASQTIPADGREGTRAFVSRREVRTAGAHGARPASAARGGRPRVRWGQLTLYAAGLGLMSAGNASKMQAVPLYLASLGLPTAVVGLTFSWMAAMEAVFMPPVGRLADRMSRKWVVALGAGGGAVFFAAIALVHGSAAVVLAFPTISFMIAALAGVGIGYAQDLDPANPGLAGGLYFAAQGLGVASGGALIAAGEGALGLPRAFLWPAGAMLAGGAAVLFTRPQRQVRPRVQPAGAPAAGR